VTANGNLLTSPGRQILASRIEAHCRAHGFNVGALETARLLSYLGDAFTTGSRKLADSFLSSQQFDFDCLASIRDCLAQELTAAEREFVTACIDHALQREKTGPEASDSLILPENPCRALAQRYLATLLAKDRRAAREIITEAIAGGIDIRAIYLQIFQPVLYEVGRLWQLNRISVADEHFFTAATQSIMIELYQQIITGPRIGKTLVAACVGSELHEIGIRMVADFFELNGWDTYYLGAGVSQEAIVKAIVEKKADWVALSATMTCHIGNTRELIEEIRSAITDRSITIMVGGRPFINHRGLWQEIGADLWAEDAEQAIVVASRRKT